MKLPLFFLPSSDEQWYGYYGDVTDNKPYVAKENITLPIGKSENSFSGFSSGKIRLPKEEELTKRSWDFTGFFNTDYLVFSYLTKKSESEPIPRGIGSYFLEKSGNDYVGAITARQPKNIITICPYVLSKQDITYDEAAKKWPSLLECKKIAFPELGVIQIENITLSKNQ